MCNKHIIYYSRTGNLIKVKEILSQNKIYEHISQFSTQCSLNINQSHKLQSLQHSLHIKDVKYSLPLNGIPRTLFSTVCSGTGIPRCTVCDADSAVSLQEEEKYLNNYDKKIININKLLN